jgi:hypothetical protein
MSIPNLIKSILSIHDLQAQVNQLSAKLDEATLAINMHEDILKGMSGLNDQVEELKENQDRMERECITTDDCEDLIQRAVETLDLNEEVSNAIENLNISIKVN